MRFKLFQRSNKTNNSVERKTKMNQVTYSYEFNGKVSLQEIENSLFLAVFATECIYGRSMMRLDASFRLDKSKKSCVVNANTEVGCNIARIFTGFLIREFGEEAFKVKRLED